MSKSNRVLAKIQSATDRLLARIILPLTPRFVSPNLLSILRLALIPPIIILIIGRRYIAALILFLVAAALDAYDGALARYRKQFSDIGLILDPLSDKLLIIGIIIALLASYPFSFLLIAIVILEIALMILSTVRMQGKKAPKSANIYGKSKMLTQVIGLLLALTWLIFSGAAALYASAAFLWLSLILQSVSIFTYLQDDK